MIKYDVLMDPTRSWGAYLHDEVSGRDFLDLFGMFSSMPLGYNHGALLGDFQHEVAMYAGVKVANGAVPTIAHSKFHAAFANAEGSRWFRHFHYCQTGALAIEAAVKTAMRAAGDKRGSWVGTLAGSFHGINGYGGLVAPPNGPASVRLEGLPAGCFGRCLGEPGSEDTLFALDYALLNGELCAVLVEPIQCTFGDRVIDLNFLRRVHALCNHHGVPLIFDEIQTGFGSTGTMWYFQQIGVIPDIVCFGKKAQVSGIMVRKEFGEIFEDPAALEVTWDGDILDMIRCRYILDAYSEYSILENVRAREAQLATGVPGLRHAGLLLSLDFPDSFRRDAFVRAMDGALMLPTGERTIRWRPNLAITQAECDDVIMQAAIAMDGVHA